MNTLLLPLLLLLAACQALDYENTSSAYRIPAGTVITLNRDLTVPSGQAGVYIPGRSIGDRYTYDSSCRLETNTVAAAPVTLIPDQFVVYKVSRESQIYSGIAPGTLFAGPLFAGSMFRDGPHLLYYATYLYLRSDRQPDVRRLVCSHLQDSASLPRHLTVAEIRTTLADVMTIRFPGTNP